MHCCHCTSPLPEPTPHEAFSMRCQHCPQCKTQNPIGAEKRESMLLGLFDRVQRLEDEVYVRNAMVVVPNTPMPAGPRRKTR